MAITNWRLQGHGYFRIMATGGHTILRVCKPDSTVSKEELKALVLVKSGHVYSPPQGEAIPVNPERL